MSGHEPGYVLTPLAEADLDGIWDYVAERFGFDVADRVLDSLHDAFRLLAENPGMGHIREDIAPPPCSLIIRPERGSSFRRGRAARHPFCTR